MPHNYHKYKPKIFYSKIGLLFFAAVGLISLYFANINFAGDSQTYHIIGWALLVVAVLAWGEIVQTLFQLDGCAGIVLTYLSFFLVLSHMVGAVDWKDILTKY
ncbi:MAG: hypothetical protein FWF01_00560 [Alphaproteobacteria bacterium]|nr:hypothetical protein [Alphaproteobacteria bacterium]